LRVYDRAMLTDPLFYLVAIPAVIILGLAKGGFAGVGILAMPLMVQHVPPLQAATILMPILVVQDAVGVWAFHRSFDRRTLLIMLPGAAIGVAAGYFLAAKVDVAAIELAIGVISVAFALQKLWAARAINLAVKEGPKDWVGFLCGMASGFTSQVSHAGGPPFQVFALSKRWDRDVFIGTSTLFFTAVNYFKVPAYVALGQFTRENLLISAALLPLAILATWAGVVLVRRVPADRFYMMIYILLVLLGGKLIFDGVHGLWF
jgi:uncharacterized membrane protein YfcA